MGLAGAGFGAAKSLEQLVTEQRLRQALEAEIQMRQQGMQEQQRSNLADEGMRDRSLDIQEQVLNAPKPVPRDPIADHRAMKEIDRDLAPPQAPKRYPVTTPGPNGQPLSRLASEDEMAQGVPVYQKPEAGPKPERDPIADYKAKKEIDQQYKKPTDGPSPYASERAVRTIQSVDELMGKVGGRTAGFGSLLAGIPATDARNFKAELDTLKANIAFNELAQMREASKTGGALGQVSDREAALLSATLGAIDAGQSPENLRANLQKVKASVQRWQAAQGGASGSPVPSHGAGPTEAPTGGADPLGLGNLPRRPRGPG